MADYANWSLFHLHFWFFLKIFLGKFPAERFIEKDVNSFIKSFNENLVALDIQLKQRNESMDRPYTYMLPSGIPNSITI